MQAGHVLKRRERKWVRRFDRGHVYGPVASIRDELPEVLRPACRNSIQTERDHRSVGLVQVDSVPAEDRRWTLLGLVAHENALESGGNRCAMKSDAAIHALDNPSGKR